MNVQLLSFIAYTLKFLYFLQYRTYEHFFIRENDTNANLKINALNLKEKFSILLSNYV